MIIKVNDQYRLIHDNTQTTIQKYRKTEKGESVWTNIAYMGSLLPALKRAFELSLCSHKKTDVNNFIDNLNNTLQKFVDNLEVESSDIKISEDNKNSTEVLNNE